MRTRFLLAILLMLGLHGPGLAVEAWPKPDAIFTWRIGSGLPHQRVFAITQSTDGVLWVGTGQGLASFDGVTFRKESPWMAGGGPEPSVRRLAAGADNRLWVGLAGGRLWCRENNHWRHIAAPHGEAFPADFDTLAEDADGVLWITLLNRGILRLHDGRLEPIGEKWEREGWPRGQMRVDPKGRPIAVLGSRIAVPSGGRLVSVPGAAEDLIYLTPARDGYWVGDAHGVRLLRDGVLSPPFSPPSWGTRFLTAATEDQRGNLWVATRGYGILQYRRDGESFHYGSADGLCGDFAKCLFADRDGNLWVGSDGGGLSRVSPASFGLAGRAEGLSSDRVTALAADPDGSLWIGTLGDGLNRWDGRGFSRPDGVPAQLKIRSLAVGDGALWIGMDRGLRRFAGGELARVDAWPRDDKIVTALLFDCQGALWMGVAGSGAVFRIHAGQAREVTLVKGNRTLIVNSFAEDHDGGIWIGTGRDGLFRWHAGSVERVGELRQVTSLAADPGKGVWVAADHALWRAEDTSPTKLDAFAEAAIINALLPDGEGGLWICGSLRGGVRHLRFRLGRPVIAEFGPADGIPELQGAGAGFPQVVRTVDGKVWFSSTAGVLALNPAALVLDSPPPDLSIAEFLVGGQRRWRGGTAANVKVSPHERTIEFKLAAMDLTHPESLVFATRLDSLETRWTEQGNNPKVVHATLPAGHHVFRAKVRNHLGIWSEEQTLSFTVLPPIWQRGWFIALLSSGGALVAAATVWLALTWRERRRIQALEVERALHEERARIAMDLHDDLGGGLTQIGFLGDHMQLVAPADGPLATGAQQLARAARDLSRTLNDTVWALRPDRGDLDGLISYLGHSVEQWLEGTGVKHRFEFPEQAPRFGFGARQRQQILLASKEAVHNALKHAGAREIRFSLKESDSGITISVADDGCGFDPATATSGNGLSNLSRRMQDLGGRSVVTSTRGEGTLVRLEIPIPSNRKS